jgi:hypothetical protein
MNNLNASPKTGRSVNTRKGETRVSPHQSVSSLVDELDRSGWGDLATPDMRAARRVLRAIATLLAHEKLDLVGQGEMTVLQIAAAAQYCTKTVSLALRKLCELGAITWQAGHPAVGAFQALPGVVRVTKRVLVRMIQVFRPMKDAAEAAARLAIAADINQRIRNVKAFGAALLRDRYRRRSAKVEAASTLPPERGGPTANPPGKPSSAAMQYLLETCEHDGIPATCPSCRRRKTNGAGSAGAQTTRGGTASGQRQG